VVEKAGAMTLVETRVLEMADDPKQFVAGDVGTQNSEAKHVRVLIRRRNA
jgi:hypothetical protein